MWNEWAPEGLVMLAMSDEGSGTVERFMEERDMPYPVAAGGKSARTYGVSGLPTAFLIGYDGEVLWTGHPSGNEWVEMLPDAIKEAEAMADAWDPGERGPELENAVEAARAGQMSKAWKETDMLLKRLVEDPAATKKVEGFRADFLDRAAGRTAYAEAMVKEACYFEAQLFLEDQMALFKGTPPAAQWKATVTEWKKEKSIKALLTLDKKRVDALAKANAGDRDKALKDLRKLMDKAEGTRLEAAVRAAYDRVRG